MKIFIAYFVFGFLSLHGIHANTDSLSYENKLNIAKKKDTSLKNQILRIEEVITELQKTMYLDTLGFAHYFVAVRYSDMKSPYEELAIANARKSLSLFEKSGYRGKRMQITLDYLLKNLIRQNRYNDVIDAFTKYSGSYDIDDSRIKTEAFILKSIIFAYRELAETEAGLALIHGFINTYTIDKIGLQERADIFLKRSFLEYNKGEYKSALSSIEKALEYEHENNQNQKVERIVKFINQKALVLSKLNKIDGATELFDSFLKEELTLEDRFTLMSNAYNNFESDDKFSIAHTYAIGAYMYSKGLASHNNKITALINLVESFRNISQIDSAIYIGNKAEEIIKKQVSSVGGISQFPIYVWEQQMLNYKYKYDLEKNRQDLDAAALYVVKIDSLIPKLINNILFDGSLLQKKKEIAHWYDIGVELAHKLNSPELFIYYSDQTKALSLVRESVVNKKDISRKDSIENQLQLLITEESKLELLELSKSLDNNDSLTTSLFENREKQRVLLTSLKGLKQIKQFDNQLDFSSFKDSNISIVYYHLTDSIIYAAHINQDSINVMNIGKVDALISEVSMFNEEIRNKNFYQEKAQFLYDHLLKPFGNLSDRLVIIPDQELSLLPFEALITPTGTYLIEEHELSYALSFRHYLDCSSYSTQTIDKFKIISPDYDDSYISSISKTKGLASLNSQFSYLKHTKTEVKFLEENLSATSVQGFDISRDTFFDLLSNSDIFHFTGHAISLLGNDRLSFLALGRSGNQVEKDIFIREIAEHKTNASLVTLNACNTAVGEVIKGEGVYNLARSFFKAGAKSVISGLWEIEDYSSSEITKSFYSYLKDGKNKSKALQLAKLDYLKNVELDSRREPYYWSGLILTGNTKPIYKNQKHKFYLIGFFGLCILTILVLKLKI